MKPSDVFTLTPDCCDLRVIPPEYLYDRERKYFQSFMPEAQTVIVFGHHIVTADEWIWREDTEGRYFCAADDHMNSVIENIFGQIQDHENKIAPYPHESGLQFRYVAQAAGLGRIGRNSYLLHPDWGPWIHLRVFATTAGINGYVGEIKEGICEECEKCVKVCPADAFENGFDGLQCRKHRKSHGDYIPAGKDRTHKGCKLCALVCKTGKRPAGKFPGLKANL